MKSCKQCGKEMADEARFCAGCGTAVEATSESNPLQAERFVYTPP